LRLVADRGAEGRVLGGVEGLAQEGLAAAAKLRRLHVQEAVADREERRRLFQRFRPGLAQRRIIVEHIETSTEGGDHQIVHRPLNAQITNGDGRQAGLEPIPLLAAIDREIEAEFGPGEQQIRIDMILGEREHTAPGR
jgi:hypothetical protein